MQTVQAEISSVSEQAETSGILNKLGLNLKLVGYKKNLAIVQKKFSQFKIDATQKLFEENVFSEISNSTEKFSTSLEQFKLVTENNRMLHEEKNLLADDLANCEAHINSLLEGSTLTVRQHALNNEIDELTTMVNTMLSEEGNAYVNTLMDEEGNFNEQPRNKKHISDLERISEQKMQIASLTRLILIEKYIAESEVASKKIDTLTKDISENENRIQLLTEENKDFEQKIESLKNSIEVLNTQIDELKEKETSFKEKNGKKSS